MGLAGTELVRPMVCELGTAPPIEANESEVGAATMLGAVTFNVTVTVSGLLVAPVAVSRMVPVYVPAASPAALTETVSGVPPVVPLVLFRESQLPVLDALAV